MISVNPLGDGITQIVATRRFMGRNWYRTACYIVDGIMVDTCMRHVHDELIPLVPRYQVELVVNTHAHEDHIGNNAGLQERFGFEILAHTDEIPFIEDPSLLRLRPYQRFLFGTPDRSQANPVGSEVVGRSGSLRVIHTPGHSPGHIALFDERSGTLFAGDAYIGGEEKVLRKDVHIYDVIESYKKLASLPVGRLCPGTGKVVEDPKRRIYSKIAYMEETGAKIISMISEGHDEKTIASTILGNDLKMRLFTTGHFTALNMVRAFAKKYHGAPAAIEE